MGMASGVGCSCTLSHRSQGTTSHLAQISSLPPVVTDGESLTAERGREGFVGDKTEAISAFMLGSLALLVLVTSTRQISHSLSCSTEDIFDCYRARYGQRPTHHLRSTAAAHPPGEATHLVLTDHWSL